MLGETRAGVGRNALEEIDGWSLPKCRLIANFRRDTEEFVILLNADEDIGRRQA